MKSGLTKSQASALSMRAQLFTLKSKNVNMKLKWRQELLRWKRNINSREKIKMMESKMQELKWKEDQYQLETETCCAVSPLFLLAPAPCCPLESAPGLCQPGPIRRPLLFAEARSLPSYVVLSRAMTTPPWQCLWPMAVSRSVVVPWPVSLWLCPGPEPRTCP